MAGIQAFFGDDWDEALDSLKSAPGALGGIALSAVRQVRPIDVASFSLVVAGWLWLVFGYLVADDHSTLVLGLSLLPTFLWLIAGAVGCLIFEISGLGYRALAYWEAYALILLFALFGVAALRLALNPRGVRIQHGPVRAPPTTG